MCPYFSHILSEILNTTTTPVGGEPLDPDHTLRVGQWSHEGVVPFLLLVDLGPTETATCRWLPDSCLKMRLPWVYNQDVLV